MRSRSCSTNLFYVKHRSLVFDLAIVVQTVEVVLWARAPAEPVTGGVT